nr:PRD domain-containing protein [Xenorhabdus bovienii]
MLNDINASYNYDLHHDSKLRSDLATHLTVLISRLQQQIKGDLSLSYRRKEHQNFFERENSYSENMELIFEEFELIETE